MAERRRLSRLLKPYSGTPPPALDGSSRPDLLTRIAGAAVPHFVSVVMALGGDGELPALPQVRNRRPVRIAERRIVARDDTVAQLTLVDPDGAGLPRWHAGAHIDIHLPSGRIRQYSLCGDPARQHEYRIAVRRIPRGGGGSIEMHELVVGDTVEISTPRNGFLMPAPGSGSKADRLRFVAGGIGITPILPMVRRADRLGVPWSLHYLGRHLASLPFLDEVLAFGSKVRVRTDDEHGLPTAAELLDGVDARSAVYVCGPTPLIELVRRGVPAEAELHIERFSPLPVVDGDPFELELARTGVIVQVAADQSALAALREARANIAYSCQQGFCGTCVQRVLDGRVEHRDHTLTDRQRDAGQMLVCVSRAATLGGRLTLDI